MTTPTTPTASGLEQAIATAAASLARQQADRSALVSIRTATAAVISGATLDSDLLAVAVAKVRLDLLDQALAASAAPVGFAERALRDLEADRQRVTPRLAELRTQFQYMHAPQVRSDFVLRDPLKGPTRYDEALVAIKRELLYWGGASAVPSDETVQAAVAAAQAEARTFIDRTTGAVSVR